MKTISGHAFIIAAAASKDAIKLESSGKLPTFARLNVYKIS